MINKATLIGRIGRIDNKTTKQGAPMTTFSLATTKKWLDKMNNRQEITTWHTIYLFAKMAELAQKYCNVGDLIYVEGEINNRKVLDENGQEKWLYSIAASEIKFLPQSKRHAANPNPDEYEDKPDNTGNIDHRGDPVYEDIPF